MPKLRANGAELYYEDHGSGPQAIVFAHGLLWSGRMFDDQVAALKGRYRCITFDFRGQGQSEVTRGGYDMDTLAEDAAALIQALGVAPCHFLGLSMGGFIGMRLAARRPELIRSLMLVETAADPEPPENVPKYRRLNFVARWFGLGMVADRVMSIMFGRKFLDDPARAAVRHEQRRRLVANHRIGITRAVAGVIARQGVYDELGAISAPTLVISGDQDTAVVTERSHRMHKRIRDSRLAIIPGAGHTSSVEEPALVNAAIEAFLSAL
jgi:pimeloyl-ACP methyl ester carboxylesterase